MTQDSEKNANFSPEHLRRLLSSQEGRQLMALLQRDGGQALRQAAAQAKEGNTHAAQELLRPMADNPEAAALLKKLSRM